MKKKRIFLLILFLAVFALGFGIIGAGLCSSAHIQKKTCSAAAEGRVIEYRRNSHIGNKRMYTPVVEYRAGNEILTGETKAWSSSRTFAIGEYVMIGYNPANPKEFYIQNFDLSITTRLGILFLVVSSGILTVTVITLLLNKSRLDKERKQKIEAGLIVGGMILFIFVTFITIAGLKNTPFVFGGMGLFGLYAWFHEKRTKKKG